MARTLTPEQKQQLYAVVLRINNGTASDQDKRNYQYAYTKLGYRPLAQDQFNNLDAAAARIASGTASDVDKANVAHATSSFGYTPMTPASGGTSGGGATDPYANLPEPYRSMLKEMKNTLDDITSRGGSVNPNIEITPAQTAEFMKIAEGEINPYYQTQLKLAREGFLASVGYDAQTIQQNEQQLAAKYNQDFKTLAGNAAEAGMAQSGGRIQNEAALAGDTNYQIQVGRQALQNRESELARAFAQQYGGEALKGLSANLPSLGGAGTADSGEYRAGTGSQQLYNIDPAVYDQLVGSQQFNQRAAVSSRMSELENAFRQGKTLEQLRALTI